MQLDVAQWVLFVYELDLVAFKGNKSNTKTMPTRKPFFFFNLISHICSFDIQLKSELQAVLRSGPLETRLSP